MCAYDILTHEHCYYISTPPIHDVREDGVVKFNENVINLRSRFRIVVGIANISKLRQFK